MKNILILIALVFSFSAFSAVSLDTQCHKVADQIDRNYCHKKRLQLIDKEMAKDKATWKKNLSAAVKKQKLDRLQAKVTENQAFLAMLQDEVKVYEKHLAELKAAKVVKEKKKKKKDNRSDVEKALNIKL